MPIASHRAPAKLIVALVASVVWPIETRLLRAHSQNVQAAPSAEFEVASIKLNTSDGLPPLNPVVMLMMRSVATSASNGRFSMRGPNAIPLNVLIQLAYDVKDFQVVGGPSWVKSERYEVDARAEGGATFDQMRLMLQPLLADRFSLALRREIRQLPVYELVPANASLRITPMKEGSCVGPDQATPFAPLNICGGVRRQIASVAPERRDIIEAVGVPMPKLIEFLSEEVSRIVLDKTGFTELFNFRLEFGSTLASGFPAPGAPVISGLSIFAALEEQLGLRLRPVTGPVEVLVIDRVERPSPN